MPGSLFEYQKLAQRLLRDKGQTFNNPDDLRVYANRARREVAMRSMCLRVLTPISGSIVGWNVTNQGSGYSATPTLTVSAPDFPSGTGANPGGAQATARANIFGGKIFSIDSQYGGAGYFQPQMVITDSTGTGATATPVMSPLNLLLQAKEVYPFSGVDLSQNPGVVSVISVRSISIIYSNYRYSLPVYSFSTYQARIRNYPFQYQYVPAFASQYGRGTSGSFYVYPLPSQTYQYELDCFCLPQDLIDDQSVEALPDPYTDAVPFLMLYYAYAELQNFNIAKFWDQEFDKWMLRYAHATLPGRVSNPYGRW